MNKNDIISITSQEIKINISEVRWSNRKYSGALPNNFEANVSIAVNGVIYFDEPYTSIGELLLQLREWKESTSNGQMQPFFFNSLDTQDNPILSITDDFNTGNWTLTMWFSACQPHLKAETAFNLLSHLHQTLEEIISENFGNITIAW